MSVGLLSFGFLSLVPLLGLGITSSRQARDNRTGSEIAATLAEEARQGTLVAGSSYLDDQGNACASNVACYLTSTTLAPAPSTAANGSLTRLTVQVTPLATPQRSQFYAVVFSPP